MHGKLLLVANRAGARLIEVRERGRSLTLLESFDNARGRLHDGDLETDRPGRTFDSAGEGRHALGREESASERVAADFARELAGHVAAALNTPAFDELVLVAEPRFLGLLRGALDKVSAKAVVASVDKDLVDLDLAALSTQLAEALAPAHPR